MELTFLVLWAYLQYFSIDNVLNIDSLNPYFSFIYSTNTVEELLHAMYYNAIVQ